jgi:4-hydroxybenzoate polyprenyltransferase
MDRDHLLAPQSTPIRAPESPARQSTLGAWWAALRPVQWAKNLLLAVPLLAAHQAGNSAKLRALALALAAFCLAASAIYIANDLTDRQSDRHHPRKCRRPFASGRLSLGAGLVAAALLMAAAGTISCAYLPPPFTGLLLMYVALSMAYSLALKRRLLVDVLVLAGLYTLRVYAGGAAVGSPGAPVPISPWLLAFSMFFFLSLAFAKRHAEMQIVQAQGAREATGRGYWTADLPVLAHAGLASGYLAVLVLAQYVSADAAHHLYQRPQLLWLVCPVLLYWITRIWFLVARGSVDDDPLNFALTDSRSYLVGGLMVLIFLVAGPHH